MQQTQPLTEKDLFLKELRSVTGPAHKQLEELPLSQAIVSPVVTLSYYTLYLAKMQAFVSAFERELFPLLEPVFGNLNERRKAGWLQRDLAALASKGLPVLYVEPFHFKPQLPLPFLAGAMYVLEGSTLGGKFIYRNIHAALSLNEHDGATYFNGYGADTGRQWSSFLAQLCHYATEQNKQEIFKGADETFKLLFDLLRR